jgi:hypothetical protein
METVLFSGVLTYPYNMCEVSAGDYIDNNIQENCKTYL